MDVVALIKNREALGLHASNGVPAIGRVVIDEISAQAELMLRVPSAPDSRIVLRIAIEVDERDAYTLVCSIQAIEKGAVGPRDETVYSLSKLGRRAD